MGSEERGGRRMIADHFGTRGWCCCCSALLTSLYSPIFLHANFRPPLPINSPGPPCRPICSHARVFRCDAC
jgi:hypothetical protein